jgi:6-phosphogluconolactonase
LQRAWSKRIRQGMAGTAASCLLALTGCGAFFQCEGKADCGTGSTSTGTGDYVYVSNSPTGSTYINGYQIGSGALTALSGSPYSLGYIPVAMAVAQNNNFLYVASAPGSASPGVYMYIVNSLTGVLSGGTLENNDVIGAMTISPDGNYLFDVAAASGVVSEYQINQSTGALTAEPTFPTSALATGTNCAVTTATPSSQSCSITVSPNENYVAVALNGAGINVFPYSSSTSNGGITSAAYTQINLPSGYFPYSLAYDSNNYLYVAGTGSAGAALFTYPGTSTSYSNLYNYATSGSLPRSVALSAMSNYLYTANESTSSIQGFTVSGGTPTAIASAGLLGPANVGAVAVDRSGTYLLAAGYNTTNGLQLLTISPTALTASASAGTSATTGIPVVLALTH